MLTFSSFIFCSQRWYTQTKRKQSSASRKTDCRQEKSARRETNTRFRSRTWARKNSGRHRFKWTTYVFDEMEEHRWSRFGSIATSKCQMPANCYQILWGTVNLASKYQWNSLRVFDSKKNQQLKVKKNMVEYRYRNARFLTTQIQKMILTWNFQKKIEIIKKNNENIKILPNNFLFYSYISNHKTKEFSVKFRRQTKIKHKKM